MTLSSGSEILSKISTSTLAAGYIHKQLQDHFKTEKFFWVIFQTSMPLIKFD